MIDISEGKTGKYIIHGVFAVIGALISIGLSAVLGLIPFFLGIVLVVLAVFLFSASSGLEIDTNDNKYRTYSVLAGRKTGVWSSFSTPVQVKLQIHADNATREMIPGIPMPSVSVKVLTYDIKLYFEANDPIVIYDFTDYKSAKRTLKEIKDAYAIPAVNKVAEKMMENRQKRSRR